MVYHPFVARVADGVVMRRERMLPLRGEVLVATGSRTDPSDIVAVAMLPSQLRLLNVAKALSVDSEDLARHLQVGVGEGVAANSVLAVKQGRSRLFKRTYRSPVEGTIVGIANGRLLVQCSRALLELEALYRGTVINAMSGLGVIIEVSGALIQGLWGSGKEGFGVLRMGVEDPAEAIDPEAIDVSCRGSVLVAGSSVTEEALYRARETEVRAIVTGGLDGRLRDLASSMPFPVIVTGGMGVVALSRPIFDLLRTHEGREASVRGTMIARGGALRPEIIVYVIPAGQESVSEWRPEFVLREGSPVRVVGGPDFGKVGRVVGLPVRREPVQTGASFKGVEVMLEGGKEVFVPQANLEVFG